MHQKLVNGKIVMVEDIPSIRRTFKPLPMKPQRKYVGSYDAFDLAKHIKGFKDKKSRNELTSGS